MNRNTEIKDISGPRLRDVIAQSIGISFISWSAYVQWCKQQKLNDNIMLLPKFFSVTFFIVGSLSSLYPTFWPSGTKVNNTAFVMALCAVISETVLEAVSTEEVTTELLEEIVPIIPDTINDVDEEIKRVQDENDQGDKEETKASSETHVPDESVNEQEAGGSSGQDADMSKQLAATDLKEVDDSVQDEVTTGTSAGSEKKEKVKDDPLRLILNLAVTEIIKNNPKKMSDAFSDHIEGIASVEKDGTVSKEPETPVILRLPNDVIDFADSIELSDEPINTIGQEHKDSVTSEVMDYLDSSEEKRDIGEIDESFLEEVTKSVRFKVPEKPDSIFYDPRTQQGNSGEADHLTEVKATTGEFGYTEANDTEFGYTEGNQVVYGYDTSASERD